VTDRLRKLLRTAPKVDLQLLLPWTVSFVAFVVVQPLISLLHETVVLVAAFLLSLAAASPALAVPIRSLVADPVYANLALEAIGNIKAQGLAVAAPIGVMFHSLAPTLFQDPGLVVEGTWVSALIASGSSELSQLLTAAIADGFLIFAGVLLAHWALRGRPLLRVALGPGRGDEMVLFGLLLQARGVFAILTARLAHADLEAAGLVHIGTKLLLTTRQSYESTVLPLSPWLSLAVRIATLATVYGVTLLLARLAPGWPRTAHPAPAKTGRIAPSAGRRIFHLVQLLSAVAAVVVLATVFPVFDLARTNFGYDNVVMGDSYATSDVQSARSEAEVASQSSPNPSSASLRPSIVSISRQSQRFVYSVDGKEDLIRGIGYNVIYRYLPAEERARRYDRDFARMRDAGVNTILGWDRDKGYEHDRFDELLLAKARENGLGVMMPYYLPPEGDYRDEAYQAKVRNDVAAWVRRFKDNPAVRMWAIGNEVLHGMPSTGDPQTFSEFYLKLADAVHAVDPNHPVIYRDAEDVYLAPIKEALLASGVKRPWLVYGMNIFTFRIRQVLADWQAHSPDLPLVVTEFAPNGLPPEERPWGLVKMWQTILRHRSNALGGVVYVWTTVGPEPIDRLFGLVDGDGFPVDGSLEAIAAEFRHTVTETRNAGDIEKPN